MRRAHSPVRCTDCCKRPQRTLSELLKEELDRLEGSDHGAAVSEPGNRTFVKGSPGDLDCVNNALD
jgi:hypothetical protein